LDTAEYSLSNISLRWMIEQIALTECEILFDYDAFDRWHIPHAVGQHTYSSPAKGAGSPTSENGFSGDIDKEDAVQKITDELRRKPLWWILEIFPMPYKYQNKKKWVTTWW
jgi:hypothetical protein